MAKHLKQSQRVTWNIQEPFKTKRPKDSNLIFCPSASRAKLQFKTFKKAVDYIRWNSKEIYQESGRAPIRVYWCSKCACFHVTSRPHNKTPEEYKKSLIKKLLSRALIEGSMRVAHDLLERSKEMILEFTGDELIELESQINLVESELDRREFDSKVKESEYLLRISDWSGAEESIQRLEEIGLNPDKICQLRETLENKIK
jgi:hypothetical protein